MCSIPKIAVVILTLISSVSAYSVPGNVPPSVRELLKPVRQFHVSVEMQRDVAEQRLKMLERELGRQKERRGLLSGSLKSSLVSADLRLDESRNACNSVRNYNRSVLECARLPVVEETVESLTSVCNQEDDPGACFANRLVGFETLKLIFGYRCKEVKKQQQTIKTTMMICSELRRRFDERMAVKTSENPVILELRGVLIGMNILKREIKMVKEQIDAFTLPTPEPIVSPSPYFEVFI